jgi:uncharacterized membrane protein
VLAQAVAPGWTVKVGVGIAFTVTVAVALFADVHVPLVITAL